MQLEIRFYFFNPDCGQILEEVPRGDVGRPPNKVVKNIRSVSLLEQTFVLQTLEEYVRLLYWALPLRQRARERN